MISSSIEQTCSASSSGLQSHERGNPLYCVRVCVCVCVGADGDPALWQLGLCSSRQTLQLRCLLLTSQGNKYMVRSQLVPAATCSTRKRRAEARAKASVPNLQIHKPCSVPMRNHYQEARGRSDTWTGQTRPSPVPSARLRCCTIFTPSTSTLQINAGRPGNFIGMWLFVGEARSSTDEAFLSLWALSTHYVEVANVNRVDLVIGATKWS